MKLSFHLLILLTLLCGACSVKKRSYRGGYYVSWNHASHKQFITDRNEPSQRDLKEKQLEVVVETKTPVEVFASINKETEFIQTRKLNLDLFKDTCGDVITLRKGAEVKARVLEINETQIKYKRCDNPDGPLIIISKNDVYSIKYSTGMLEHFDRVLPPVNKNPEEKPTHKLAILTLALTIGLPVLGILGLIGAIVVGNRAKKEILAEPGKYKGLEMVNICLIICYVFLALGLILTLCFLFLLGLLAI